MRKIISWCLMMSCMLCIMPACAVEGANAATQAAAPEYLGAPTVSTEVEVIPSTEPAITEHVHQYVPRRIEATCTADGYSLYVCTCEESYIDETIEALGHAFTEWVIITNPGCESDGLKESRCIRCNERKTECIQATGHLYGNWTSVQKATCTASGKEKSVCSQCNHAQTRETAPMGHSYSNWNITNPVTCTQDGFRQKACLSCGIQIIESIPKVGHIYEDGSCTECDEKDPNAYPMVYSDETCTITVYKEWYKSAWVYAAHIEFTDYTRFGVACANGKYNYGRETTSKAADRLGAILCINGDYAVPGNGAGGYAIARQGIVCNNKPIWCEGLYNAYTGKLTYRDEVAGQMLSDMVAAQKVTDTFQFGPAFLLNGTIYGDKNSSSRAQRTFIGTNGNPGDIWLCVSDGRYNDGKSAGLNYYQCGSYLVSKGCTLGVPMDGGGSSTICFMGKVLNAAAGNERAVVDFVHFK